MSVLIVRLPQNGHIILSRSKCRECHRALGFQDLIPLVSWLFLRGKCRHCEAPIGLRYLTIEIAAVLISVWSYASLPNDLYWIGCLFGWCLLTLAVIDYQHFILPDSLNLFLALLGLYILYELPVDDTYGHILGALIGLVTFFSISFFYRLVRKKEGLGFGDIKLFSVIGIWVGWNGLPSVLLIACGGAIANILIRNSLGLRFIKNEKIPFGTFLCLGAWIIWLYGPIRLAI
ncbi:MAG: prepilin peptidase [Sneathiella sp.]